MQRQLNLLKVLDDAIGLFEFFDIVMKSIHQPLGMLRCEYDPRLDPALGRTGHHINEVEHELRMTVGDDGKIRILPFRHLFRYLYIQLILFRVGHMMFFERTKLTELGN